MLMSPLSWQALSHFTVGGTEVWEGMSFTQGYLAREREWILRPNFDQVHSPILSTTAHLAWVTGWFWVLSSIPFPHTPSCPNFGPHSQQEEADTFQKAFTSPSSNVPHTQPGSQQASFGKQEMDCISSSLCLRWEAKVIFQLKSLPSLNGRTQYGFFISLWCFPTWLEPHPHLSSRSTWNFCTYLALPSAFWPLLYFSLVGVPLGYTPCIYADNSRPSAR